MNPELKQALNQTLIDGLTPRMKETIDRLLGRGFSKLSVMTTVTAMANKAAGDDQNKGKLIIAAVEAYLNSK